MSTQAGAIGRGWERGNMAGFVSNIGESVLNRWRVVRHVSAVICGVLYLAVRPRYWPRTVRNVVGRQVLFTGIDALPLTLGIALLAGVSIVSQTQLWLTRFGQSGMLGPILVAVIVRELGPLLVNFIVIARSGTAMATECANMRVRGEVDVLDAQGLDPMSYIVMPRVIGAAVSVFGLVIVFVAGAFVSGYVVGFLLGVSPGNPLMFVTQIGSAVTGGVLVSFLMKTFLAGLLTGAICCIEGLSVSGTATEVPIAGSRAVVRAIAGLLVVSALTSILTY